ncbi:hypothetical protein MY10362_008393 [Beauveria mimosiformis]
MKELSRKRQWCGHVPAENQGFGKGRLPLVRRFLIVAEKIQMDRIERETVELSMHLRNAPRLAADPGQGWWAAVVPGCIRSPASIFIMENGVVKLQDTAR